MSHEEASQTSVNVSPASSYYTEATATADLSDEETVVQEPENTENYKDLPEEQGQPRRRVSSSSAPPPTTNASQLKSFTETTDLPASALAPSSTRISHNSGGQTPMAARQAMMKKQYTGPMSFGS